MNINVMNDVFVQHDRLVRDGSPFPMDPLLVADKLMQYIQVPMQKYDTGFEPRTMGPMETNSPYTSCPNMNSPSS